MKQYALVAALVLTVTIPVLTGAQGAGVSADLQSDISAQVKGVVNALIGEKSTTSTSVDAETNVFIEAGGDASSDSSGGASSDVQVLILTRADVESDTSVNTSVTPASVRTEADLSGYAAAQIASDENISKVKTSSDNVAVTYKQRAWLLGVVPVTVHATAIVRVDGSVDIQYPWYAFLMKTNEAELETALESRVAASGSLSVAGSASADAGFSSQAQAELIEEISSTLEASLSADLAAEATQSSSVE